LCWTGRRQISGVQEIRLAGNPIAEIARKAGKPIDEVCPSARHAILFELQPR
jgi:hypothetical protein